MKNKLYMILYSISLMLVVGFLITIVIDYKNYDPISTSAPFYAVILIRFAQFLLLSIVLAIFAIILKHKKNG